MPTASNDDAHSIASPSSSHDADEDTYMTGTPDHYDTDSEDSSSDFPERDLKAFDNFPAGLRTVKPLITDDEINYGAMEIVQNPWEYLDGNELGDLLPIVRARLSNSMRE